MRSREGIWPARHAVIAAVFVIFAVILGGGGSPNPGTEIILQLLFVVVALAWLWLPAADGRVPLPRTASAWLICALVVALPLAQLVPLPPGLWTHLAGQEDRVAALSLVGRASSWQPASHAPSLTLAGLLAAIPALFAFVAAAALDVRGRSWLVGTIAAMALVTALIGAVQVSLGSGGLNLYSEFHRGVVTGFMANRNGAADLLLIGMVATAAFLAPSLIRSDAKGAADGVVIVPDRRTAVLMAGSALLILLFAAILTASRTGIALIPLAMLGIWIVLRSALADLGRWRFLPLALALAAGLLVALVLFAGDTTLAAVGQRFSASGDFRIELWRDGWFAMQRAWPFGVGMGGVQSALIAAERLEILDPLLPNRMHNDYLELALEAGVGGLAVLAAIAVLLGWLVWRAWRTRPQQRHLTACGATFLAVVAAHSFVDYPLRSMALACLVGTGAGLLVAPPRTLTHSAAAATASNA